MRTIALLAVILLAACSGGSEDDNTPEILTYDDCQMAGGEMRFNEPHECHIFGDVFYDKTPLAKFVDYGPATGYFASPVGSGSYPAIVLIHEWWGLDKTMWSFARMLAEEGYVVLAVDLYDGVSTTDPERASELGTAVGNDPDGTFEHLGEAVHWLSLLHNVDDTRLGVVGWNYGSDWASAMADNAIGTDAAVLYYGQFNAENGLEAMRTQVMNSFGEDGHTIPVDDPKAFRAKREIADEEYQLLIYPNDARVLIQESVTPAAKKAWEDTRDFLHELWGER